MKSAKLTAAALAIAEVSAVLAVAAATVVPVLAHASADASSAAACADAVAITMAPAGAEAPKYTLNYQGSNSASSAADFYASEYTFDMKVADPKSGVAIARALCTTRKDGSIVKLTVVPLAAKPKVATKL